MAIGSAPVGTAAFSTASTNSATATYTSTAGNLLVLHIQHQTALVDHITDSAGNTWVLGPDSMATNTAVGQKRVQGAYCLNAAAVTSVTVFYATGTTGVLDGQLEEWAGALAYRGGNSSISSSTTPGAVTVAGTSTGDLVTGSIGYTEATAGTRLDTLTGSGYTETPGATVSNSRISTAYSIRPSSGISGPSWTMSSGTTGSETMVFSPTAVATPTASFTASASGLTVTFSGAGSTPVSGDTITAYAWTYGDGGTDTGVTPAAHTYSSAGTYSVSLKVTDSNGNTNTSTQSVTVAAAATQVGVGPVTAASGYTLAGSASTIQAALNDTDPTTALVAPTNADGTVVQYVPLQAITYTSGQPLVITLGADLVGTTGSLAVALCEGSASTVRSAAQTLTLVDTITVAIGGTPTGGTFTLASSGHGATSTAIAYNASAATVAAALTAAFGFTVTVAVDTSKATGYVYSITAASGAGLTLSGLSSTSSLTGGTPTITLRNTALGDPVVAQFLITYPAADCATVTNWNNVGISLKPISS